MGAADRGRKSSPSERQAPPTLYLPQARKRSIVATGRDNKSKHVPIFSPPILSLRIPRCLLIDGGFIGYTPQPSHLPSH